MRGRLVEAGGRSGEALGAELLQIGVVSQGKETARTKQPRLIYIYILTSIIVRLGLQNPS